MNNPQLPSKPWHSHQFYAMGCQMSAWLELADECTAQAALHQVEALFQAAEARMTRFAESSELSRLNARPGEWVFLSNGLWTVIQQALQLAEQTNGLFDPTLLNALTAAGYAHDFVAMQQQGPAHGQRVYPATAHVGRWREVQVDTTHHAVCLPQGVRLDLGGIGKGYTAQQAVNFLSQWGPCLVDAGGDLVAGDAPADLPGWSVAIAAPCPDIPSTNAPSTNAPSTNAPSTNAPSITKAAGEHDLAQLWLKNGTLATSGIDYRRWSQDGNAMHHLIDPRTGEPAQTDLLTVSVLAADATVAEAWATALLIVGKTDKDALPAQRIAAAFVDQQQNLTVTAALYPFVQMPVVSM